MSDYPHQEQGRAPWEGNARQQQPPKRRKQKKKKEEKKEEVQIHCVTLLRLFLPCTGTPPRSTRIDILSKVGSHLTDIQAINQAIDQPNG
jgi:hypothetical protein